MLIRRKKIARLIARERKRERMLCDKDRANALKNLKKETEERNREAMRELKEYYEKIIIQKNNQIRTLRKEIDKHYFLYQEIRKREATLDVVTEDVEEEVEKMLIKVHESIQPFYRTRAKVETIKRLSNRKNGKMENIFLAVK